MAQASQFFNFSSANIATVDLGIIDQCLDALFSNNSGPGAPSGWGSIPGMSWYDNDLPTADGGLLKHVNSGASGWYGVFSGSSNFKIWAYLSSLTAEEGWVRDANVADVVTALKSTSGTYATSGEVAPLSSWGITGIIAAPESTHTHPHDHKWFDYIGGDASDKSGDGLSLDRTYRSVTNPSNKFSLSGVQAGSDPDWLYSFSGDRSTDTDATPPAAAHTHTITHTSGWRIRAAVGIMVYCDV